MRSEATGDSDLPNTLLILISVILTVIAALFLTFSDTLQTRPPVAVQPTTAVDSAIQSTLIAPLPTSTPSPTPTTTQTAEPPTSPTPTPFSIVAQAICNNTPAGWIPVILGANETLLDLSIRYGVTLGEIIQANCLEGSTVIPGMTIYVPPSPPTRLDCGPPQWWTTYVVRRGETLSLLARRHGTTVYAIMQANCLTDTRIIAGLRLYLPPIQATVPPPPIVVFPTKTPIPSPTPTATSLPSPTPSPTNDGTASPTATNTVPAGTAVPTNTPTVTGTPPVTPTPSPTVSGTPPASPTATTSPTAGPSPTSGASPTAVPSSTPTLPATNTPQPTNTTQPTSPPTNTPPPTATSPPQPTNTPPPEPSDTAEF